MSTEIENEPYSKSDIMLGISGIFQDSFDFFSSFSESEFSQELEKGWSIAENLDHLIKSTYLIPISLLFPKFIYIILSRI